MSADNYNLVRKVDGKWHVWLNLSASCDDDQNIDGRPPVRVFDELDVAVPWADGKCSTEYGTRVDACEELPSTSERRSADQEMLEVLYRIANACETIADYVKVIANRR